MAFAKMQLPRSSLRGGRSSGCAPGLWLCLPGGHSVGPPQTRLIAVSPTRSEHPGPGALWNASRYRYACRTAMQDVFPWRGSPSAPREPDCSFPALPCAGHPHRASVFW